MKNQETVLKAVQDKDVVVHLAAGSSFLMYEKRPTYETVNVIHSFLNILEAVRKYGVGRLVYASTSAVYEGNDPPYHEDMALRPPDHKALAKKVAEEMADLYGRRYGIKTIGVRPFSVYGVGEADKKGFANVISLFSWAMLSGNRPVVWGDGNQTRDFIYVDDVAEMFHECAVGNINVPVVNAGTGVETSFNQVITILNQFLCTDLAPVYVPVAVDIYAKRLLADTSVQERHGFKAETDVQHGIQKSSRVRSCSQSH